MERNGNSGERPLCYPNDPSFGKPKPPTSPLSSFSPVFIFLEPSSNELQCLKLWTRDRRCAPDRGRATWVHSPDLIASFNHSFSAHWVPMTCRPPCSAGSVRQHWPPRGRVSFDRAPPHSLPLASLPRAARPTRLPVLSHPGGLLVHALFLQAAGGPRARMLAPALPTSRP